MYNYTVYIDEIGDNSISYNGISDNSKYFFLCGVLIENQYYLSYFNPIIEKFKYRHIGKILKKTVILHQTEIAKKKMILVF